MSISRSILGLSLSSKRQFCAAATSLKTRVATRHNVVKEGETKVKLSPLNIHPAVDLMKASCWAKFDETVEISVNLGVDPRKPNQSIKGVASLPHGTGKIVRIGVFAAGVDADKALEEGADVVGGPELIALISQSGGAKGLEFDRVIATPEMMPQLSRIGRILGPRGLMPNPKMGSVTTDVAKAIQAAKLGSVQFRVDRHGIVHAGIGKKSFPAVKILENVRSFMMALSDAKPEGLKGKYIKNVSLSTTMGPGVPVEVASVDPSNGKFMLDATKLGR